MKKKTVKKVKRYSAAGISIAAVGAFLVLAFLDAWKDNRI